MKLAILALLLGLAASAQPSYDAASIKPNHSPSEAMGGTIGIGFGGGVDAQCHAPPADFDRVRS